MGYTDLTRAMQQFDRAVQHRDRAEAEGILDEDYALVLVHPLPAVMPRVRWLEVLENYVVHAYDIEAQQTDERGTVAAVLSRVRMKATVLGEDRKRCFGSDGVAVRTQKDRSVTRKIADRRRDVWPGGQHATKGATAWTAERSRYAPAPASASPALT